MLPLERHQPNQPVSLFIHSENDFYCGLSKNESDQQIAYFWHCCFQDIFLSFVSNSGTKPKAKTRPDDLTISPKSIIVYFTVQFDLAAFCKLCRKREIIITCRKPARNDETSDVWRQETLFCNSITTSTLFDRNLLIIECLWGSSNDSKTWQKHLFMVRSSLSVVLCAPWIYCKYLLKQASIGNQEKLSRYQWISLRLNSINRQLMINAAMWFGYVKCDHEIIINVPSKVIFQ